MSYRYEIWTKDVTTRFGEFDEIMKTTNDKLVGNGTLP